MPTIELISIDCPAIPALPTYRSFAYRAETRLESHRALFQAVFDSLSGVIVHLANKEMEGEDGCWFAGKLMDWTSTKADRDRELHAFATSIVRTVREAATEQEQIEAVKEYLLKRSILPETCDTVLVFLPDTRSDVHDLMRKLLDASPQHRITFSSDYQFGGERRECGEVTLSEFFALHDRRQLWYNALYYIRADEEKRSPGCRNDIGANS